MFLIFKQTGLSKQCRPRSHCSSTDQGLHCLPFHLHRFTLLYGKPILVKFQDNYSNFLGMQMFRIFTVFHTKPVLLLLLYPAFQPQQCLFIYWILVNMLVVQYVCVHIVCVTTCLLFPLRAKVSCDL